MGQKIISCSMPWNSLPSVFLPSALRAACWQLVWHVCHSHSFTLNCFGAWHFIPIKGSAALLFSLCCRSILIDHSLMRLSDLRCLEWNFRTWNIQYCTWTVHAVVKSGAAQQHSYWRRYCTHTGVTCRPMTDHLCLQHACPCKRQHVSGCLTVIQVKFTAFTVTD